MTNDDQRRSYAVQKVLSAGFKHSRDIGHPLARHAEFVHPDRKHPVFVPYEPRETVWFGTLMDSLDRSK